ncbi:NUDIX hydrolase [Spirochaeta thermophila DSM 6578]|uniref:8-oxo-dGTP diphosphatase n=1 Tax=Winmispira thermophila (strain ATCC 700085 / DSM 6578 / Z-1203) TaxID=869211 RepID=G0GFU7_WINT7|nr:NUDIX domain-containing protein [Spirochaeta thermophila]AEJ61640.1 NUDIX hydrolase [Spirochaeta thermophila DSM 6578]
MRDAGHPERSSAPVFGGKGLVWEGEVEGKSLWEETRLETCSIHVLPWHEGPGITEPGDIPPTPEDTEHPALRLYLAARLHIPPASLFPDHTVVVAALLVSPEGNILLGKRKRGPHAGLWEFPGGKALPQETAREALSRELEEELHLRLPDHLFRFFYVYEYVQERLLLVSYLAPLLHLPGHLEDHQEITLVPPGDAQALSILPGDREILSTLLWTMERGWSIRWKDDAGGRT